MEDEGRVYAPQDGHDSQIINGDGQITGYLKEFMSSEGLLNRGNDYLVLSVLGCQSSGKSCVAMSTTHLPPFPVSKTGSMTHVLYPLECVCPIDASLHS